MAECVGPTTPLALNTKAGQPEKRESPSPCPHTHPLLFLLLLLFLLFPLLLLLPLFPVVLRRTRRADEGCRGSGRCRCERRAQGSHEVAAGLAQLPPALLILTQLLQIAPRRPAQPLHVLPLLVCPEHNHKQATSSTMTATTMQDNRLLIFLPPPLLQPHHHHYTTDHDKTDPYNL